MDALRRLQELVRVRNQSGQHAQATSDIKQAGHDEESKTIRSSDVHPKRSAESVEEEEQSGFTETSEIGSGGAIGMKGQVFEEPSEIGAQGLRTRKGQYVNTNALWQHVFPWRPTHSDETMPAGPTPLSHPQADEQNPTASRKVRPGLSRFERLGSQFVQPWSQGEVPGGQSNLDPTSCKIVDWKKYKHWSLQARAEGQGCKGKQSMKLNKGVLEKLASVPELQDLVDEKLAEIRPIQDVLNDSLQLYEALKQRGINSGGFPGNPGRSSSSDRVRALSDDFGATKLRYNNQSDSCRRQGDVSELDDSNSSDGRRREKERVDQLRRLQRRKGTVGHAGMKMQPLTKKYFKDFAIENSYFQNLVKELNIGGDGCDGYRPKRITPLDLLLNVHGLDEVFVVGMTMIRDAYNALSHLRLGTKQAHNKEKNPYRLSSSSGSWEDVDDSGANSSHSEGDVSVDEEEDRSRPRRRNSLDALNHHRNKMHFQRQLDGADDMLYEQHQPKPLIKEKRNEYGRLLLDSSSIKTPGSKRRRKITTALQGKAQAHRVKLSQKHNAETQIEQGIPRQGSYVRMRPARYKVKRRNETSDWNAAAAEVQEQQSNSSQRRNARSQVEDRNPQQNSYVRLRPVHCEYNQRKETNDWKIPSSRDASISARKGVSGPDQGDGAVLPSHPKLYRLSKPRATTGEVESMYDWPDQMQMIQEHEDLSCRKLHWEPTSLGDIEAIYKRMYPGPRFDGLKPDEQHVVLLGFIESLQKKHILQVNPQGSYTQPFTVEWSLLEQLGPLQRLRTAMAGHADSSAEGRVSSGLKNMRKLPGLDVVHGRRLEPQCTGDAQGHSPLRTKAMANFMQMKAAQPASGNGEKYIPWRPSSVPKPELAQPIANMDWSWEQQPLRDGVEPAFTVAQHSLSKVSNKHATPYQPTNKPTKSSISPKSKTPAESGIEIHVPTQGQRLSSGLRTPANKTPLTASFFHGDPLAVIGNDPGIVDESRIGAGPKMHAAQIPLQLMSPPLGKGKANSKRRGLRKVTFDFPDNDRAPFPAKHGWPGVELRTSRQPKATFDWQIPPSSKGHKREV